MLERHMGYGSSSRSLRVCRKDKEQSGMVNNISIADID
jgi:hypothetical protein